MDSIVLLDALHRIARTLGFHLAALHVNHQLSPNAGRWSVFCRDWCRARGIPFRAVKVRVPRGNSLEAAARAARYAAFAGAAADYVVLAQHQDDQAETVLLQLLRGAGVKGLAAMPIIRSEDRGSRIQGKPRTRSLPQLNPQSSIPNPRIFRPLLDVTRAEIEAYARQRKLKWIEDESNQDVYFQRNFLRHEVLPVLAKRFPAYRATIARSAAHLAEAARLLDEVAAADGMEQLEGGALAVGALRRLPPARARNLMRFFLAGHGVSMPGVERLEEALRQALSARQDARVRVDLGGFDLQRFQDRLHVVPRLAPVRKEYSRRWRGERTLALPELGGVLVMAPSRGQGVGLERLRGGAVTIRLRRGGERLQPDCRRPRRSLKNLLQETGIPPWQRERMPLVFCGQNLVWAPGVGTECAFQAAPGEAAVHPVWDVRA